MEDPHTRLVTDRLILRPLVASDAAAVADLSNDETLARNASRVPYPYTLKDAKERINAMREGRSQGVEYEFGAFAGDTMVASASIRKSENEWELGFGVHRGARGRGYATELASAICKFGFDALGLVQIHAGHHHDNPRSGRVLQKLGFTPTGEKSVIYSKGRGENVAGIEYILMRENFVPRR